MDVAASQPQWGLLISQYPQACQSKAWIFQPLVHSGHNYGGLQEFILIRSTRMWPLSRRMLSVGRSSACPHHLADPLVPRRAMPYPRKFGLVDRGMLFSTVVLLRQRLTMKFPFA